MPTSASPSVHFAMRMWASALRSGIGSRGGVCRSRANGRRLEGIYCSGGRLNLLKARCAVFVSCFRLIKARSFCAASSWANSPSSLR